MPQTLAQKMDFDGAFYALKNAVKSEERVAKWRKSLGADNTGVWDTLSREVARRFIEGKLDFDDACEVAHMIWDWMLTFTGDGESLATDADDVYLAFDAGLWGLEDGSDPVTTLTIPQLRAILARSRETGQQTTTANKSEQDDAYQRPC